MLMSFSIDSVNIDSVTSSFRRQISQGFNKSPTHNNYYVNVAVNKQLQSPEEREGFVSNQTAMLARCISKVGKDAGKALMKSNSPVVKFSGLALHLASGVAPKLDITKKILSRFP